MTAVLRYLLLILIFSLFAFSSTAQAGEADDALKRMIERAADYQEGQHFLAVVMMAIETDPDHAGELANFAIRLHPASEVALLEAIEAQEMPVYLANGDTPAERLTQIAEAEAAKPKPRFFAPGAWDGEVSLGGSFLTGNTEEKAVSLGLKLDRIDEEWEHHFDIQADYSSNRGRTTKERFLLGYDSKWFYLNRGYIFALTDFQRDSFSEFDWRVSEAVGLGYRLYESEAMRWDVEGGPGARQTKLAANGVQSEFIFVARSNYNWKFRDNMEFTDTASVFIGSERTTLTNAAAVTADLTERLSGRIGFHVKYDTSVPLGQEKLDTATRASIVYGF